MSESLQTDDELCDFLAPDDDSLELLETNSARLPFPVHTPSVRRHGGSCAKTSSCAMTMGRPSRPRGRTMEDLDRVRDLIPDDWLNDYR
ncbi:hypothetical protein [Streptomyces sp. NBC_00557]|uniref:hypothetical protein n=1 Tax=Streptomyces sp. NBC_00557 TaxID=2975776 RepID=UPI002E815B5A|nr:hypothetical protein [Streptomyces sp. NBC_00557]WUC40304.1 hypothetical protein OG956_39815 [Streptomyces sp. NBC_00557]